MGRHRATVRALGTTIGGGLRRFGAAALAVVLATGLLAVTTTSSAVAADPTASMTINKSSTASTPTPGEKFSYVIQVQCTAGTVSGCVNAAVTDPLPEGITIAGPISVSGNDQTPVITPADRTTEFTVTFADNVGGEPGLTAGIVVTITVPVQLDPAYPPELSGQPLDNTATITADNANPKEATATVTPDVPPVLDAETVKDIVQPGDLPEPGTAADATITGTNTSNVPVDQLVISDPVDPTADPNPFTYLALTGLGEITLPEGAEQVQVRAFVDGAWVDGPLGPPAALPAGVDPADVRGLQFVFSNSSGGGIVPGAQATVALGLEQTEAVVDAPKPLIVTNTADTTVTLGDESATSDPASDTYKIPPADVQVGASKSFDPDEVKAGDPSTVTLGVVNQTDNTIDSLTIVEPSPGTPNPFTEGLTFTGLGTDGAGAGIVWPRGATEATIVYSCNGTPGAPQSTTTPDTLPAPPAGCDPVTGFEVTFSGEIAQGAEATVPFGVLTDPDQDVDELIRSNQIDVIGRLATIVGTDTAADEILSIADRLAVEVGKRISPAQIPALPGQFVVNQLTGRVLPFGDSTIDARQIIVSDPDPLADDQWFDAFVPKSVTATAVPADATLTVQYWDGAAWIDVPDMVGIAGPTIVNAEFPAGVQENAQGIRFVYDSTLPEPEGFAPGTSVAPNFTSALRPEFAGSDAVISNCAGAAASNGDISAVADPTACDDVELIPYDPGQIDPIDKAWDKDLLNARSGQSSGVTIAWSTQGYTGLQQGTITDSADPDTTAVNQSVYDVFDLVRLDAITPAMDPLLTFDQITGVELYRLAPGDIDPAAGSWVDATNDPCPAACDGAFPGFDLTAAEQADTVGFRFTYAESPTRAQRISKPTDPPVGTGLAPSLGNNRKIHPVFRLRDDLRSDADTPVIDDQVFNLAGRPGEIRNTVRATGWFDVDVDPVLTVTDGDDIAIVDIPLTVAATKSWTGGPMSRPQDGVPADQYPTGRVTIGGKNTTPAKVDRLVLTDPLTSDPFDAFNLVGFEAITDPASVGASTLEIVLTGSTECTAASPCSRVQALTLSEASLVDVTGITLTYTGRINAAASVAATYDVRLRPELRESGDRTPTGAYDNEVGVDIADLENYPGVDTRTASDDAAATMLVQPSGVDVRAAKSFDPDTITEPSDGPTTVTLQGQPDGVSRTVEMSLTDTSATFFNAYDLDSLLPVTLTAPIDRVRVDAWVGGSWELDGDGNPQIVGGNWETGEFVAGPAVSLPDGVTAADVQGLRYTFTRADGENWENPAHPIQRVQFDVTRRDTLNTGGPVPSDLAGSDPAPGETVAGDTTNTVTADVTSSDTDGAGNPLTATDDAEAVVHYAHANNGVRVEKSPNSQQQPGRPFTYTLKVTNIGDVAISNPVITDRFPTDDQGSLTVWPEDTGDRFGYATSDGSGMPVDPEQITATDSDTGVSFAFPAGTTLAIGGTYTITYQLQTRPGLPANTPFTNTFGITGDRPWDTCDGQLDTESGECRASATNSVISAGAMSVSKQVRGEGSDELGVVTDPLVGNPPDCVADSDGFYSRPCVPVAEPGGDIDWRMRFLNSGNRPVDRIVAVDRLPSVGDRLATDPDLQRGSQWRPLLTGVRPSLTDGDATLNIWFTTAATPCTLDLGTDDTRCTAGSWVEWPDGAPLPVDPEAVTGIKFELLPTTPLAPAATMGVQVPMVAPAFSATAGPDTISYNTIGMSGRWVTATNSGYTLSTEPARVGVALATGSLQVVKQVAGEAAEYAPDAFAATLSCTSVDQRVPLTDEQANLVLTAGETVTVENLPYHAQCLLTESDSGQTWSNSTAAIVQRTTTELGTAVLTNVYEYASLTVSKQVDTAAVDQDGEPIGYGPFTVGVSCTLLDEPVFGAGYSVDEPMSVELSDGDSATFTHLPAGASCTVTETDAKGAPSSSITITRESVDPETTDGTEATLRLIADPTPYTGEESSNTAAFTNHFDVGSLQLTKDVVGEVADLYGAGPFTLHVSCVLDDASGSRTAYDADVVLSDPLTATIDNLATGSVCSVTEPDDAGASTTSIDPETPVTIGTGADPVTVTVTNSFDPGRLLLTKQITGEAADYAAGSFQVEVTCLADDAVLPGFPQTVTVAVGQDTEVDTLVGAECSAVETETGSATGVSYEPAAADVDGSAGVTVPAEDPNDPDFEPARITVTNEYRAGGLQIVKDLAGPGASIAGGPYTFAVACAFNGADEVFTNTVTLQRSGDESTLASPVIGGLPVGADCTVTETDNGGADTVPAPVQVTITDVDDQGEPTVVLAGFVNVYSAATVQVAKVLAGDGADAKADTTFTVDVTCQVQIGDDRAGVYSGSVALKGGETVPVLGSAGEPALLPLGTRCWALESDTGGADGVAVDFDSYDNAAIVVAAEEAGLLSITVTNTFDAPPVTTPPTTEPTTAGPTTSGPTTAGPTTGGPTTAAPTTSDTAVAGGDGGDLSNTGVPVLRQVAIAALLLALGAALMLVFRRRRGAH